MIFTSQSTHDASCTVTQGTASRCKCIISALLHLACLWLAGTSLVLAAAPEIINYQGQINVGGTLVTDPAGQFKFALVDNTDTTTYWSNDGTSINGSEPASAVSIPVNAGLFSVGLGDTTITNMTSGITSSVVADNVPVYVKVWFNDGISGFQALSPTLPLVSVPYALNATSVPPGSITEAELADEAVTSAKLAAGAVTASSIAAGSITSTELAIGSVGTDALADGSITADKIKAGDKQTGSISTTDPGWPNVVFSPSFASTPQLELTAGSLNRISSTSFTLGNEYPRTVTSYGDVGVYTSMAVVNGKPAISYHDRGNRDLKYVIASDADGSSWGLSITLDSVGNVGEYTSLSLVNGKPAISYYDSSYLGNGDLKYVIANDADGNSWGAPVTIDSVGDVGLFTSLTVVNGKPAISYYDSTNSDLKYVIANDSDGTSWGTPITIEWSGLSGAYTSLAVVNGRPAISYLDSTNQDLKYVRASDANGSAWGTPPVVVDNAGSVGRHTSLTVVNGKPAISYYDYHYTNKDLKYVIASDANGSAWGTPVIVQNVGDVGEYNSLAVVNGKPAISYFDITVGVSAVLSYVIANDADGSSWGAPVTADNNGSSGAYTSMAVVNGKPAISYYDENTKDLKFVIASDTNGSNWDTVYWTAHATLDIAVSTASTATLLGSLSEDDVVQAGATDSIDSNMLAYGSITSSKLADDSVDNQALADNSVGTLNIYDGSVYPQDLAEDYVIVSGDTMSGSLTIETLDTDISDISLHGSVQGSGRLFVGQDANYGGGLLYNGDDDPDIVGNTDRVTFFRRELGTDSEVMSYAYNSNNIRIQGRLDSDCTADANASPNSGCLRIGDTAGLFLLMDVNEINARNGTGPATLYLQHEGGAVAVNGVIQHASDVNMKQDFGFVDGQGVLDRLASLQISEWTYKHDGQEGTRHIGPTSQDFKVAFGLGDGDKHIATVDADGIALTAIKALREEKDAQIDELKFLLAEKDTVMTEQALALTLQGHELTLQARELALLKDALARMERRLNQDNLVR